MNYTEGIFFEMPLFLLLTRFEKIKIPVIYSFTVYLRCDYLVKPVLLSVTFEPKNLF